MGWRWAAAARVLARGDEDSLVRSCSRTRRTTRVDRLRSELLTALLVQARYQGVDLTWFLAIELEWAAAASLRTLALDFVLDAAIRLRKHRASKCKIRASETRARTAL